jgi:hypothetical protein
MGKKARKLRSPKYANKASALRDTFARLRGQITETVETVVEAPTEIATKAVEPAPEETKQNPNALKFIKEDKETQLEEPNVEAPNLEKPETIIKTTPAVKKTPTTKKTTSNTPKKTTSATRRRRTTKTKS